MRNIKNLEGKKKPPRDEEEKPKDGSIKRVKEKVFQKTKKGMIVTKTVEISN